MKKGKTLRRLAAVILAGTMMLAMSTSVFAVEDELVPDDNTSTQVTLTKTVDAETNVMAPNTSFTFAIANGSATTKTENGKNVVVYAGVTDGAYFADGADTITFAPGDSLTKTTNVSIDVTKFPTPGVYRYKVTETAGTYDGITYDNTSYYMDVYVINGTNGNEIQAVTTSKITIKDGVETSAKSDLTFTNIYTTNDLTLKKVVAGNQADMSKKFTFTITVNGVQGEKYATSKTGVVLTSGTAASVELGHNETITVYGLSANDTYTIVETDYTSDGYETTITGADVNGTTAAALTATGNVANGDDTVVYTNTKEVTTPTGIITNVLPYVLMVAAAAALVFVFLRKREYDR